MEVHTATLAGRTALVTGASSGIGRATALALGGAGARVALVARDERKLEKLESELADVGVSAVSIRADVCDSVAVDHGVRDAADALGPIDILVTAAGTLSKGRLVDVTDDAVASTFRTNVFGTIYACRAVVPGMVERRFGRIITVSSVLGLVGITHRSVYSASKAAVISFSKSLAGEIAEHGVTVNSIAPGPIQKDNAVAGQPNPLPSDDPAPSRMIDQEVLVHRWGVPDDVARVALMLALDSTGFINGSVLTVDGGYTSH